MNNSCEYCAYYCQDLARIKSYCTISSKGELIMNYEDLIELESFNPCIKFKNKETAFRDVMIKELKQ